MGRPLRTEWTRDITVHCIEKEGGEEVTSKLEKQVGYNKYRDTNGVIIRLVDKEELKDAGTGYVVVTDIEKGKEKSLFKLTKHKVVCTDGSVYYINPEVIIDKDGKVTGITLPEDSDVAIEGLEGGEEASS